MDSEIDNSALEELMEREITPEMQREFFEIFKRSQLFMPVVFSGDFPEDAKPGDVVEPEDHIGFSINYLSDEDGNNAVPLFTSEKVMASAGLESSVMAIFMSDLAGMLEQTDKYSIVAINPFTSHDVNMPVDAFMNLFRDSSDRISEILEKILPVIKERSVELEENTTLFFRSDENMMVENAVDGVFVPQMPFHVSSNPKYGEGMKYTNILLMPEGKRIFPIGPDEELDIIIAPGTEFRLEDTLDGTQNLWMCGAQPFYDE